MMLRPRLLLSSRHLGDCATPRTATPLVPRLQRFCPALPTITIARRAYSDSQPTAVSPPSAAGQEEPTRWKRHDNFRKIIHGPKTYTRLPVDPLHRLRDACQCSQCVDPDSGQKTFATTDLPDKISVQSFERYKDGTVKIVWADDFLSNGGTHESMYDSGSLRPTTRATRQQTIKRTLWDRAILTEKLADCRISYDDWMAGGAEFSNAFAQLHKTGLVFVHGVPESETSVEDIGQQVGRLQDTFYGLTWDVVSKPNAENVAYTSRFLGLHQDLLYYREWPRLQLLHCISNDCDGGESLFSDGARAAMQMQLQYPKLYKTLITSEVNYHYVKNGHYYISSRPTINHRPTGFVSSVAWSPPFQAPFSRSTKVDEWLAAAKVFRSLIESPANMYEYKMPPGECVIFDNRRVLHGRQQFTNEKGRRWLKGTYVSDQVFLGKTWNLASELKGHTTRSSEGQLWQRETRMLTAQLKELEPTS